MKPHIMVSLLLKSAKTELFLWCYTRAHYATLSSLLNPIEPPLENFYVHFSTCLVHSFKHVRCHAVTTQQPRVESNQDKHKTLIDTPLKKELLIHPPTIRHNSNHIIDSRKLTYFLKWSTNEANSNLGEPWSFLFRSLSRLERCLLLPSLTFSSSGNILHKIFPTLGSTSWNNKTSNVISLVETRR